MQTYPSPFDLLTQYRFSVFPLRDHTDRSCEHAPKKPRKGFSWLRYQTNMPEEEQVLLWQEKYPQANWGIVCGKISNLLVLDLDTTNAIEYARKNFVKTPIAVRTAHGAHLYYQYEDSIADILRTKMSEYDKIGIHVRSDGNYVVAPGSIHESGARYALFEPFAGAWCEGLAPVFAFERGGVDIDLGSRIAHGGRHNAILSYVGTLIANGMSQNEVLNLARKYYAKECEQSPPIPDKEIVSIVLSTFRSDARKSKNKKSLSSPLTEKISTTDSLFSEGLKIADVPEYHTEDWPSVILHPGGLLETIADYVFSSAVKTEKIFGVAGAIALMGGLLGQRVQTESGVQTNIYIASIGGSSTGKDAPRNAINRILCDERLPESLHELYGGTAIASDTAIARHLAKFPRTILCLDELGMLLKGAHVQNSALNMLVKTLTEFYSSNQSLSYSKIYAKAEENIKIPWRSLSVLGSSVPSEFWESVSTGETSNGFLARFIVLESLTSTERPSLKKNREIPKILLDMVKSVWSIEEKGATAPSAGSKSVDVPLVKPKPHIIKFSLDAEREHTQLFQHFYDLQVAADKDGHAMEGSIYGRAAENALKLALIHWGSNYALHRNIRALIEREDVIWAWAVIQESISRTIARAKACIHETDFESYVQRVIDCIRRYVARERASGKECLGVTRRVLSRTLRGINVRTMQDVLDKLVEQDKLRAVESKATAKGGRPTTLYCLVDDI